MKVETASAVFTSGCAAPTNRPHRQRRRAPGIEIRCDAGFVVTPGTYSPWGAWTCDTNGPHLADVDQLRAAWRHVSTGTAQTGHAR